MCCHSRRCVRNIAQLKLIFSTISAKMIGQPNYSAEHVRNSEGLLRLSGNAKFLPRNCARKQFPSRYSAGTECTEARFKFIRLYVIRDNKGGTRKLLYLLPIIENKISSWERSSLSSRCFKLNILDVQSKTEVVDGYRALFNYLSIKTQKVWRAVFF